MPKFPPIYALPDPKPDGIEGLFLTGSTQEHYGVQDCTVDDPFRMVPKQTFIDEIKFKGAISDMYVLKAQIEKYKGEELMIHYDDDEIYGQNFFVCTKPERAEYFLLEQQKRLDAFAAAGGGSGPPGGGGEGGGEAEDEGDGYVEVEYVPPVSKPWVSMGSEQDIADEAMTDTRDRYVLAVQRRRKEFSQPYKFSDREASEDPNIQQNGRLTDHREACALSLLTHTRMHAEILPARSEHLHA